MRPAYLFDLDGTLINSSALVQARNAKQWKECARRLHETAPYPGIMNLLTAIRNGGTKIAVVTTSVSFYAEKALQHHGLPYDTLVAYHDVTNTKPAPDCYLLALRRLGLAPESAIGIGDDAVDADALRKGRILSVGAAWNSEFHAEANWDFVVQSPAAVLTL